MDTEENNEIKHALLTGKHATDEGPYYHESWWESYKGGVKGKLGGVVIGALIGAVVGVGAAVVLSVALAGSFGISAAMTVIGGFSATGMVYAAHEFSEVGKVTGAVAAAHEKSEQRMQSFENGKFAELKREISELKSLVTGKSVAKVALPDACDDHPVTHSNHHGPNEKTPLVFWKIAAIGLTIGLAAGALLAGVGLTHEIIEAVGYEAAEKLSDNGIMAISTMSMGMFGASFGINRDIFRKIFDKTDLLFKGIVMRQPEVAKNIEHAHAKEAPVTTVVYDNYAEAQQSDTYHRDKVLAQAKQALLSMDHTKAVPH